VLIPGNFGNERLLKIHGNLMESGEIKRIPMVEYWSIPDFRHRAITPLSQIRVPVISSRYENRIWLTCSLAGLELLRWPGAGAGLPGRGPGAAAVAHHALIAAVGCLVLPYWSRPVVHRPGPFRTFLRIPEFRACVAQH
jgi:hypothetical protein